MSEASTSLVCLDATYEGNITLGSGNILQPRCVIDARLGRIIIGNHNIIEETARIVHPGGNHGPLVIGDKNHIAVQAEINGNVGNGNVIQEKALVAGGSSVGNHCVIGIGCSTVKGQTVQDRQTLFGSNNEITQNSEPQQVQEDFQQQHLQYLREVLPKFYQMRDSLP